MMCDGRLYRCFCLLDIPLFFPEKASDWISNHKLLTAAGCLAFGAVVGGLCYRSKVVPAVQEVAAATKDVRTTKQAPVSAHRPQDGFLSEYVSLAPHRFTRSFNHCYHPRTVEPPGGVFSLHLSF